MPRDDVERKEYTKPEVTHEIELETKAGSPLGSDPDPLNLPGS